MAFLNEEVGFIMRVRARRITHSERMRARYKRGSPRERSRDSFNMARSFEKLALALCAVLYIPGAATRATTKLIS